MREIIWLESKSNRVPDGTEVRIRVEKSQKHTRITFYGTSIAKITRKEHVKVGISLERVYFDEANERGNKVCKTGKNVYIRLPGIKPDWEGDYKLNYDAELKLWYIERRKK